MVSDAAQDNSCSGCMCALLLDVTELVVFAVQTIMTLVALLYRHEGDMLKAHQRVFQQKGQATQVNSMVEQQPDVTTVRAC